LAARVHTIAPACPREKNKAVPVQFQRDTGQCRSLVARSSRRTALRRSCSTPWSLSVSFSQAPRCTLPSAAHALGMRTGGRAAAAVSRCGSAGLCGLTWGGAASPTPRPSSRAAGRTKLRDRLRRKPAYIIPHTRIPPTAYPRGMRAESPCSESHLLTPGPRSPRLP